MHALKTEADDDHPRMTIRITLQPTGSYGAKYASPSPVSELDLTLTPKHVPQRARSERTPTTYSKHVLFKACKGHTLAGTACKGHTLAKRAKGTR